MKHNLTWIIFIAILLLSLYMYKDKIINVTNNMSNLEMTQANKIINGLQYIEQNNLKYDDFIKYIGLEIPTSTYFDFRTKSLRNELTPDYIVGKLK